MEWMLILGYFFFAVGGVLIIIGFARLIWWGATYERHKRRPLRVDYSPNFHAYYKDPWLRAPSMASIISRHENSNEETLQVDTDAIYAVPADNKPRAVYLQPSPPTDHDHELSQTESQIYSDGVNGSSSSRSNADGSSGYISSNIYSVLDNMSSRKVHHVNAIDERDNVGPALPSRAYNTDIRNMTEADRPHMRSSGFGDPPADYSPERVVLNHTPGSEFGAYTYPNSKTSSNSASSKTYSHTMMSSSRERSDTRSQDSSDGSKLQELSGSDLANKSVFRDSSIDDTSTRTRSNTSGSVKSMRSLYQYMYTEEPCALDNEMEYTFTSSVH